MLTGVFRPEAAAAVDQVSRRYVLRPWSFVVTCSTRMCWLSRRSGNFEVYGFHGVSVFAETNEVGWMDLAATKFAAVPRLVLFTAGDLQTAASNCGTPARRHTTT